MEQHVTLVTGTDRARAAIKYELNHLKNELAKYLEHSNGLRQHRDEINTLCDTIASKYWDYLRLLEPLSAVTLPALPTVPCCAEHFSTILNLERQMPQVITMEEKKRLLVEIITLYKQVQTPGGLDSLIQLSELSRHLKQLFSIKQLDLWLIGLIDFWNQHESAAVDLTVLFHDWNVSQQQLALNFFSEVKFIDVVNAIFFYKLHPDKLFADLPYPEKLLSVRTRLGLLHYYIESMQQQLYRVALHHGLRPGVDRLLHGNEWPQGVMIEVDENICTMIQAAIKKLKVMAITQNNKPATLALLYDLNRAYKYWFNPNQLIDTVMILQQHLISTTKIQDVFLQEMVILFGQLTTTECLDLYGYFTNNDSRYLLYTFFAITQGISFDWLPVLNNRERVLIQDVFCALLGVFEALRMELNNRHVITAPYNYDLAKQNIQIGHRNREAVRRTITIYKHHQVAPDDAVEQLFRLVEEP